MLSKGRCMHKKLDIKDANKAMYIDKTEKEYTNLINNFEYFKLFENNDYIFLNGRRNNKNNRRWKSS